MPLLFGLHTFELAIHSVKIIVLRYCLNKKSAHTKLYTLIIFFKPLNNLH